MVITHILFGAAALILGLVGLFSKKRVGLHTRNGFLFHVAVLMTCFSTCALAMEHWQYYWWLFIIGVLSYAAVLIGHCAARFRWSGWLSWHIICLCSSYISMVTAFLVVNRSILPGYLGIPSYWGWFIPTLIGTPLIAATLKRYTVKKPARQDA